MSTLTLNLETILSEVNLYKSEVESTEKEPAADTDWDAILNNALESTDSNTGIEINQHAYEIPNSRKKTFLDKLRSPKPVPEDQKEIPDWFFDENGDLNRNEIESESRGFGRF